MSISALRDFPGGSVVKNWPANVGDAGDLDSIPGSRRSPGGRNGNLLQYSCLENPMDRGAWWATVHGVTKSRTRLSEFHFILQCILVWTVYFQVLQSHTCLVDTLGGTDLEVTIFVGLQRCSSGEDDHHSAR